MVGNTSFIVDSISFRQNEEEFKMFLKNLTTDSFLEFLISINKKLRNITSNEDVLYDGMFAGDLVAPTEEVRHKVLIDLVNYIKKANNLKEIATITYYTIINLHMFSDGNGRTSRFLYDLISGEIDEKSLVYYYHDKDDYHYREQENFEKLKGILDVSEVNYISNSFCRKDVQQYIDIDSEKLDKKQIYVAFGGDYENRKTRMIEMLKNNLNLNLTEKEWHDLALILLDNSGVKYSPSGISMMIMAIEKGQIEKWIEKNEQRISRVNKNDNIYQLIANSMRFTLTDNIELLSEWTSDDLRKLIKIGNYIKYSQFHNMIDIFLNSKNYTFGSETELKNYIMEPEKVKRNKGL